MEFGFSYIKQFGFVPLNYADTRVEVLENGAETTILSFATPLLLIIGMYLLIAICAYLLGSLNFAVMISKARYHDDIRLHGSNNAGTTNMMRTYGTHSAALTFAGDAAKGVVSTMIGGLLMGQTGAAVAALFCVLGHVFPLYFGFRGGKGVAVAAATILWINPLVFLFVVLVFVGIVWWTKYLSLGSIMGAAVYPVLLFNFTQPQLRGMPNILSVVVATIVIILHHANIRRLWRGEENKFSFKKSVKTEPAKKSLHSAGDEDED